MAILNNPPKKFRQLKQDFRINYFDKVDGHKHKNRNYIEVDRFALDNFPSFYTIKIFQNSPSANKLVRYC